MQDIPKIVRARLQRPQAVTADAHPDADLLTAFAERSLAGHERELVTKHLAHCGDCREVIALALPATEDVVVVAQIQRANWLSLPVLRWGVVTAGILAVTSAGVLQLRERSQEKKASAVLMARNESHDTSGKVPLHLNEPVAPNVNSLADSKSRAKVSTQLSSVPEGASRSDRGTRSVDAIFAQPRPAPRSDSQPLTGGSLQREPVPGHNFVSLPRSPSSSLEGKQRDAKQGSASAAQSSSSFTAQSAEPAVVAEAQGGAPQVATQTIESNAPADRVAQDGDSEATRVGKAKAALQQTSPAMAAAPSLRPDPALMKTVILPRWTISSSGALQRSLDGGKIWTDINLAANNSASANLWSSSQNVSTPQAGPETKKLATENSQTAPATIFRALAVSSNASEVWAGGSNAALYHTLNGGGLWVRVVPSASGISLTGDIVSIQFSETRNGTVTTSNAEVWTTNDNGQTWTKRQ